jgi:hypothetical protein
MRNSRIIVFTILFISFLFNCCSKIDENLKVDFKNNFVNARNDSCYPDFDNNVFDSIGQIHNLLVNSIVSLCDSTSSESFILSVMENEVTDSFGSGYVQYIQDFESTQQVLNYIDHDSISYYLNTLNITNFEKQQILNLFELIEEYDGTNICEIIEDIKSFEQGLIASYNSNFLRKILYASSVARHSLYYWDADYNNERIQLRWPWKKWIITGADIFGALAGVFSDNPYVAVTWSISASVGAAKIYDELAAK